MRLVLIVVCEKSLSFIDGEAHDNRNFGLKQQLTNVM